MMASNLASTGTEPTTNGTVATSASSEHDEKNVVDVSGNTIEDSDTPPDFPLSWKIIALCCGVALSFGSSFAENILGPLKSTLRKELDITNAQVRLQVNIVFNVIDGG